MNREFLQKYAELLIKVGVNIQKNDTLYLAFNEDGIPLSKCIAESAYRAGASHVELIYSDHDVQRMAYLNESEESLVSFPDWYRDRANGIARNKACYMALLSDDPDIFSDIDSELLAKVARAKHSVMKEYYDAATSNEIRWCLCAVPNKAWASKIFPDISPDSAVVKLWDMIAKTMRLDRDDPVAAWSEHIDNLEYRSEYLTSQKFTSFIIKNNLGTDLEVGMPDDYYFSGGYELAKDGVGFTANMPTEEVFSLPHKYHVNGIVYSSMPLVHNGKTVDKFYLRLENGRIVDYGAERGIDVLKGIIDSDEGSHYLGEIAFVQYDSPIRSLNTLFYETLFDENASCHLAIGEAYPMVKGADSMSEDEQDMAGINNSSEHVDFMFGTRDLSIVGIKADGTGVDIMRDGNFVIGK